MSENVTLKNPNLEKMNGDFLYHLGINVANTKDTKDIQEKFGDIKFICMGGTDSRMEFCARHLQTLLEPNSNKPLINLTKDAGRYAMFKVGPVLVCSHGLGMSSFGVLLHELLKLVMYAKCRDPIFIRLGTCGGLGVPQGTVVVTKDAYNGYLKNEHEIAILGKKVARKATFNQDVGEAILKCAKDAKFDFVISGNTMAAECFYEGQGRLDGASCDYTNDDKMAFLKKCYDIGIRNIEMEATMFSALMRHVKVKAADVCVTLIDRLKGDQIEITKEQKENIEERPIELIGLYIKKALAFQ